MDVSRRDVGVAADGSAECVLLLEHDHVPARVGEQIGRDEAVGSGSDDDGVGRGVHRTIIAECFAEWFARSVSITTKVMACDASDVFAVLRDGWLYPSWVVGASRVRNVDANWPDVGSRLEHSVGVWPALVSDHTRVEAVQTDQLLQLMARAWPAGQARVRIELAPHTDGVLVQIHEDAVAGPGALLPKALRSPILDWRNTETLRRLAFIAEHRARS